MPNPHPESRSGRAVAAIRSELLEQGSRPSKQPFVVERNGRAVNVMHNRVPCLTHTRCMSGGQYLTHKRPFVTMSEMLKLQGFSIPRKPRKRRSWAFRRVLSPGDAGMVGRANSADVCLEREKRSNAFNAQMDVDVAQSTLKTVHWNSCRAGVRI